MSLCAIHLFRFVNWMYGSELLSFNVPSNPGVSNSTMMPNGEWTLMDREAGVEKLNINSNEQTFKIPMVGKDCSLT